MAERKARMFKLPSEAAQWAMTKLDPDGDGNVPCPFCGFRNTATELDEQKNLVGHHLDKEHLTKMEFARLHWDQLGWAAHEKLTELAKREELELSKPDLEIGEDFNEFDYLYVASEIKDKVRGRGGKLRWATPRNVQRYKDRGMVVVNRGEAEMPNQHSTEDSTARANELVLMEVPQQLSERRERYRKERVRQQGDTIARLEDLDHAQSDLAKNAYDHYRQKGMPHDNAMRMSRNFENRVASGDIAPPEPGENRYTHRR